MTKEEFIKNLLDSGFKKMSRMFAKDHMFRTDDEIVIYMYMYGDEENQILTIAINIMDKISITLFRDYGDEMISDKVFWHFDKAWEYLCE